MCLKQELVPFSTGKKGKERKGWKR